MKFDGTYFRDEIREGFYIPGMTKRSWARQIDILEIIANICDRYNIKWFADYGTLIGAARHKGFIPWDDDLDICMIRDDYEKFNQIIKDELPEGFRVLNLENEIEGTDFLTRICNSNQLDMNVAYLQKHHGFPYMAGIDIFPLDYLYPDQSLEQDRVDRAKRLCGLLNEIEEKPLPYYEICERAKQIMDCQFDDSIPVEASLRRMIEQVFSEYSGRESKQLAIMPLYIKTGRHFYPIDCFSSFVYLPFENGSIRVPVNYEKVLEIEYGRWEKANKHGGAHSYPYYGEQEKVLILKTGTAPYHYIFEDITSTLDAERAEHNIESDQNIKILELISQAHDEICKLIEKNDFDTTIELIKQCQELAIKVGTDVDQHCGEESNTVKLLEDYCEYIYGIYVKISNGEGINYFQIRKKLAKNLNDISDMYIKETHKNMQVLFLVPYADSWEQLIPIYDKYYNQPNTLVSVMPIPYAERNDDGSMGREFWEYDRFPDNLNLIRFDEYDFAHSKPDVIVIDNPFDEYESGITVHPFFYSRNIRKYTDELLYIHNIKIDDFDLDDEKSLVNARAYVVSPGVVYADKVYVRTDKMKDIYITCLENNLPNFDRKAWNDKIDVISWNTGGNRKHNGNKKNIIFYVSMADYCADFESTKRWIKRSFDTFKENSSINVIWIYETETEDNIQKTNPQKLNEYQELISEFISMGLGERVQSADLDEILDEADAYYGTGGYVMNQCVRVHIPVMLRNKEL